MKFFDMFKNVRFAPKMESDTLFSGSLRKKKNQTTNMQCLVTHLKLIDQSQSPVINLGDSDMKLLRRRRGKNCQK